MLISFVILCFTKVQGIAMTDLKKCVDLFDIILEAEDRRDKKLYSINVLVYNSPFVDEDKQFENYSMHAIYMVEDSRSIEEGVIGNVISPCEPYFLVENDILLEFSDNKVDIFRAEMQDGILKLVQKVKKAEDNVFLVSYLAAKLNIRNY